MNLNFNENVKRVKKTDKESKEEMVECKIKSFGMFSEDLSNILMMLLKDNEKYKNMIEKGFSDIDNKLISMTEKFETCNKENEQKIAAINSTINNHNYEIQALRNKVTDIETLSDLMMNSIGKLFHFII